jgi:hypothetical protein
VRQERLRPAHDWHKAAAPASSIAPLGPTCPGTTSAPSGLDGLLFHRMAHLLNTAAGLASGHPQLWLEPPPVVPESLPLSAITLALGALCARMCTRTGDVGPYHRSAQRLDGVARAWAGASCAQGAGGPLRGEHPIASLADGPFSGALRTFGRLPAPSSVGRTLARSARPRRPVLLRSPHQGGQQA